MLSTKATRVIQNGRVFYVVALRAADLVHLTKVDVWDPEDESGTKGYQRAPSRRRKKEIAEYAIGSDAVMPLGGLVNARSKDGEGEYGRQLEFKCESEQGSISFGVLSIGREALPLHVVDMQHRIGGYQFAIEELGAEHLADFPLVVTIADGLSLMEEVDQFDLINTTQKKVRTDLARRLKAIQVADPEKRIALDQKGKLWEARGPKVVSVLVRTEGSPWYMRVVPPNATRKDYPDSVVRETSFVTSLKPVLQTPYFQRISESAAAQLIMRYWEAIARLYPAALSNPRDYVLQKTPGVFAFHSIAPEVFELARDRGELSADSMLEVLNPVRDAFDDEFWATDNEEGAAQFGSMKGFRILASRLREHLPSLEITA